MNTASAEDGISTDDLAKFEHCHLNVYHPSVQPSTLPSAIMSLSETPQSRPPDEVTQYMKALHTTALVCLVACPALALLPPRKLDLLTFGLAGGTLFSASYLIRESTGRSILDHISGTYPATPGQVQKTTNNGTIIQDDLRQRRQEDLRAPSRQLAGTLTPPRKDWVAERQEEVKEALDEGKGFGDMIMDQIWDVWNWGKKKDGDD